MLDAIVHQSKWTSLSSVLLTVVWKWPFLYRSARRNWHDDSIDDPFLNRSLATTHPILLVCFSKVLTSLAKAPKLCARRWFGLDIVIPSTQLFHWRLSACVYSLTDLLASCRPEYLKLDKIRFSLGHGLHATLPASPLRDYGWEGASQQPRIPYKWLQDKLNVATNLISTL